MASKESQIGLWKIHGTVDNQMPGNNQRHDNNLLVLHRSAILGHSVPWRIYFGWRIDFRAYPDNAPEQSLTPIEFPGIRSAGVVRKAVLFDIYLACAGGKAYRLWTASIAWAFSISSRGRAGNN